MSFALDFTLFISFQAILIMGFINVVRAKYPDSVYLRETGGLRRIFTYTNPLYAFIAALLYIISSLLITYAFLIIQQIPQGYKNQFQMARIICMQNNTHNQSCIKYIYAQTDIIDVVLIPIFFLLCCFLGNSFRSLAKHFLRINLNSMKKHDKRSPILYLRPFNEDRRRLVGPSNSPFFRFFSIGEGKITLDSILLEEGLKYGPVVAVGNPKDLLSPYGPPRDYIQNADWQSVVKKYIEQSQLIFVFVDSTPGMQWELSEIERQQKQDKCIFLISPNADKFKAKNILQEIKNKYYQNSESISSNCFGFVPISNKNSVQFLSTSYDWVSYKVAVRTVLSIKFVK
jgi:hypothetical protein